MSFLKYDQYKESGIYGLDLIPAEWHIKRLKDVATHNDDSLDEVTPGDTEILYIDISSVNTIDGIHSKESMLFSNAPSRARRCVQNGDVIVSTVRTYLKAIARVIHPEDNLIVSTGFAVIRPKDTLHTGYAGFLLLSQYFLDEVISRSTGVSYPAINASELVRISIPVPTYEEQTAIASFLDAETSKIDALVAEQRRLIELLKEKRQAVISHAVTKGLNPNAPMKDSGIEWLGEVPEHWEVVALKHLVSRPIIDGPHVSPIKYDEGIPFISAESIGKGFIDFDKKWGYISPEDHELYSQRYKPERGDILLVKLGATTGVPAIVEADTDFNIWVPLAAIRLKNYIEPYFIFHVLRSRNLRIAYELNWTYGTQQTLGLGTISNLRLPVPPSEERQKIVDYLESILPGFDSLEKEAERAIELFQERRTALISAAVTGKIDVRKYAAQETAP